MLFFSETVNLQELCCVTISVKPKEGGVKVVNSHQPQIIRCRELIFTEPDIIATPVFGNEKKVHVIMKQSFYKTGKLQARFRKLAVEPENPRGVPTSLFESCLKYTMLAKLAPAWNKVGRFLVQGRDFLTSNTKQNAVDMDVHVNGSEIRISVNASVIKMPPLKLNQLDIPLQVARQFLSTMKASIQEHSIENKWCYVLPSMKKGQIIHVTHTLPANEVFSTYKDMKRHWKNTYGYRLPENDDDMLYYQVYFKPIGEVLFTYPECCLRRNDFIVFPRADSTAITELFLHDLVAKQSAICGKKLQLRTRNPLYPTVNLREASSLQSSTIEQERNLSTEMPQLVKRQQLPQRELTGSRENITGCQRSSSMLLLGTTTTNEAVAFRAPDSSCVAATGCKIIPIFKPLTKRANSSPATNNERAVRIVPSFTARKPAVLQQAKPVMKSKTTKGEENNRQIFAPEFGLKSGHRTLPSKLSLKSTVKEPTQMDTEFVTSNKKIQDLGNAAKRKAMNPREEGISKKPRVKTKVQEVDVVTLATANQLGKVNTATLMDWLKKRGIVCKSKDKKTELVSKVMNVLKLVHSEQ